MKNKITRKAAELFITLGFKSVTMDDIANSMGISKKTIYSHFGTKTELVKEATLSIFHEITCGIDHIQQLQKNPIEELYEIKKFVMLQIKNEKISPQYQLQKYYPEIFNTLKAKQFEKMRACTIENLKRGIDLGLYRKNLNMEFASRIYFIGVNGIKDDQIFDIQHFPKAELMENYLEYHLRGIVTSQGLKTLIKTIKQQSN